MTRTSKRVLPALAPLLFLAACGGGGGGGGDNGGGPPPPPPVAVTYSVTLTELDLEDTRSGTAVDPTGLPVAGAQASRNP